MKITRRAVIYGLIVLLLLGCSMLMKIRNEGADETVRVLSLEEEKIERISYTDTNGTSVTLRRTSGGWECTDEPTLPLQQDFPRNMAARLSPLTAEREITGDADPEAYGLDEPSNTVEIRGDGFSHMILIGTRNMTTGDYYASVDGTGLYLLSETFANLFSTPCLVMIERETVPVFDYTDLRSAVLEGAGTVLSFALNDNGRWNFSKQGEDFRPASSAAVLGLYSALKKTMFSEAVSFGDLRAGEQCPTAEEIETDPVSFSDYRKITVNYGKESPEIEWSLILARGSDGRMYIHSDGSEAVYTTEEEILSDLLAAFGEDYTDYTVPYMASQRVGKIDAQIFGTEYHLSKTDGQEFNRIYYRLISLTADEIGQYEVPDGEPAAEILYTAEDGAQSLVRFYEYERGEMVTEVDGEAAWLTSRKKVMALSVT